MKLSELPDLLAYLGKAAVRDISHEFQFVAGKLNRAEYKKLDRAIEDAVPQFISLVLKFNALAQALPELHKPGLATQLKLMRRRDTDDVQGFDNFAKAAASQADWLESMDNSEAAIAFREISYVCRSITALYNDVETVARSVSPQTRKAVLDGYDIGLFKRLEKL